MTDAVTDYLYQLSLNDDTVNFDLEYVQDGRHFIGEQALCAALLDDGIKAAQGRPYGWIVHNREISFKRQEKNGRLIQEAREWVFTRNEDAFGFDFCCFFVDLDPDVLREKLRRG